MKQIVGALLAGVLIVTPAQAAVTPADPVPALKSRVAAGRGVMFTDVTSFVELSGKTKVMNRRGTLQYGKSGFAASDISVIVADQDKVSTVFADERAITVGKVSYRKGGPLAPRLPKGKSWIKINKPVPVGVSGAFSQPVNAAEPETLKALTSMGRRTGLTYTGNITFQQLSKISPWARVSLPSRRGEELIRYTLTLGSDNLPRKLVTTYLAEGHWLGRSNEGDEVHHETVYKGWGGRYTITPPPASQVYSSKQQ
ncbi:hypothetical protein GCM10010404_74690 [Nonomuraea africana]|uniref:Outer membrane lipoprotein-sorting protein n=1 Tax=Nonomuraea africana TaxID=46171 RepID=A0ABR9KDH1_9ACTN|nr:hypothetical protein [Nonomuraea africana]MBE1559875.1 hypothetical protein [Nonomuraea africana]